MTDSATKNQVTALAALLQACQLVDQLSKSGEVNEADVRPLIRSLFQFNPDTVEDIYGAPLVLGLRVMNETLGREPQQFRDAVRYAMIILSLERQLSRKPEMLSIMRSRLEHSEFRSQHFGDSFSQIAPSIAGVYQDTISTFRQRVKVTGNIQYLQDKQIAEKIRCLLLTAIRAAMLWRQLGGRRWHFVLKRKTLLGGVEEALAELPPTLY